MRSFSRSVVVPVLLLGVSAALPHLACSSSAAPIPTIRQSSLSRDLSPSVSMADQTTFALDNANFAFDMYKQLTPDDTTNLVFSPVSMGFALSMAYAAASGDTATQMATALHFTLPSTRLFAAWNALDLALASRGPQGTEPGVTLDLTGAAWADQRVNVSSAYLDTLATNFGTGVRVVDIADAPDAATAKINDWVATQTAQKITTIEPPGAITAKTRMVLVNATYLSAAWETAFDPAATTPHTFTRLDGTTVQAPMMSATTSPRATSGTGYTAVELPYAGEQVSMVIVLPDPGSFQTIQAGLTGDFVLGVFHSLQGSQDELLVPKFTIMGTTVDESTALQALGMKDAFDYNLANFKPALVDPEGNLHVEHVFHHAFISMDEKGTEAAAATAVQIDLDSGVSTGPITTVTVDRPFFFFVRDATDTVLFAGRVMDPTGS